MTAQMCSWVLGVSLCALAVSLSEAHPHGYFPGSEAHGPAAWLRDFMGGGDVRNFFHRHFMQELPEAPIGASSPIQTYPDGLKEQTFRTPAVVLAEGEIANKWIPMAWPKGHIAVQTFAADLVKDSPEGIPPPLNPCCGGVGEASREEVFMHHWTVNKWQTPASLFKDLVKSGGRDYGLESSWKNAIETWLADAGNNAGANGPCRNAELHLYFGIGNEVRGTPRHLNHSYEFPDPYAIEFNGPDMKKLGEFMMLNLHLIDIRNVTDTRRCVECDCEYLGAKPPFQGKHPSYVGGLACCHSTESDGGKCRLHAGVNTKKKQTYYMRYSVQWRDFDPATTLPLEVITFDATDNNTQWSDVSWLPASYKQSHASFHDDAVATATVSGGKSGEFLGVAACHVEYFVPPCASGESCVHKMPNSWTLPYPIDIVFVRSHFHSGGVNMTVRSQTQHICTGASTYNEETGLLEDVTACKVGTASLPAPVRVDRGAQLFAEAFYQQDSKPHFGVMAMSFVYAHVPSPTTLV